MQQPLFTDTHAHIYADEFKDDRDLIIASAIENGVKRIYLPNIDAESFPAMLNLVEAHPDHCFPMLGLHPCSVKEDYLEVLDQLWEQRNVASFIGIGETGIDLYWDKTHLKEQKDSLRIQANWAKSLGLPLILHVRDSFQEIFQVLDEVNDVSLRGIFHCFTGEEKEVQRILGYGGFYFGIGGVLTFKNTHLRETVKHIPKDRLVIETDSPYLAPVPNRGKRNQPEYLIQTATVLAESLGISIYELSNITEKNVNTLFQNAG